MPRYGNKKYHALFSKKFVKFMLQQDFKIGEDDEDTFLVKEYPEGYKDLIRSYPTSTGPSLKGEYPIWISRGYYRKFNAIEGKNKSLVGNIASVNNSYFTLLPLAAKSKEVIQSEEGIKELSQLWNEVLYPQIIKDLDIFNDLKNLNILFNYPEKSKEIGYDKIMGIENTGPRGIVRSLIIAKEAEDVLYDDLLSNYIKKYEDFDDGTPDTTKKIAEYIQIFKSV